MDDSAASSEVFPPTLDSFPQYAILIVKTSCPRKETLVLCVGWDETDVHPLPSRVTRDYQDRVGSQEDLEALEEMCDVYYIQLQFDE